MSRTLSRGAVRCRAVGGADMYGAVVEKLLWACVFWMMSAALGGMNVSVGVPSPSLHGNVEAVALGTHASLSFIGGCRCGRVTAGAAG